MNGLTIRRMAFLILLEIFIIFLPNLPGCRPLLINYMAKVMLCFDWCKYFDQKNKKKIKNIFLK